MRPFKNRYYCVVCKSSVSQPLFQVKSKPDAKYFSLVRCGNCALVTLFPQPPINQLYSRYYSAYRSPVTGQRFPLLINIMMKLWRYLRAYRMVRLASAGYILDVGCGQAIELQILKKFGLPVSGLEISKAYAQKIQKFTGIHMYHGDLTQLKLSKQKLKLITFLHSLEHIPNALASLKACHKLLSPGGYLMISVPNFESRERRLFNNYWFHLDIPRHLYHFSATWLINYLKSLGFIYLKKKHLAPEYDYYSSFQSLLNKYFADQNFVYYVLLKEEKKSCKDFYQLVKKLPYIIICVLAALPLTFWLWMTGGSGTVELVFRKPQLNL